MRRLSHSSFYKIVSKDMEELIDMFTDILGSREAAIEFLGIEAEVIETQVPPRPYIEQENEDATDRP